MKGLRLRLQTELSARLTVLDMVVERLTKLGTSLDHWPPRQRVDKFYRKIASGLTKISLCSCLALRTTAGDYTMRNILNAAIAGFFISVATPALADEAYTANSLADFFVKSADLGPARGICIGSAEECQQTSKKPASKDMLVNFELASADLTPEARKSLDVFVAALQDERLAVARFIIEGHTDASGSDAYNRSLSDRRADAVRGYIADRGVSADRLISRGVGEAQPRVADPYHPDNRRVEMRLTLD